MVNEKEMEYLKEINDDKINKITIIIDHHVKSFSRLFENCRYIKKIDFKKIIRNDINDMKYMFKGCSSLEELNLSSFNTEKVTDMTEIFSNCKTLKKLNISNFSVKWTKCLAMFQMCLSLEELIFSVNIDESYIDAMLIGNTDETKDKINKLIDNWALSID